MKANVEGIAIAPLAKQLVAAAHRSLIERKLGEEKYLAPIEETLETLANPGQRILTKFTGEWKGDIAKLVDYCAI